MNSASLTVPLSLSSDSGVFPARLNKLLLDYLNFIVSPHLLLDMVSYPAWGEGGIPMTWGAGEENDHCKRSHMIESLYYNISELNMHLHIYSVYI